MLGAHRPCSPLLRADALPWAMATCAPRRSPALFEVQDPVKRMLSAYRMYEDKMCYSMGLQPGDEGCPRPPIDEYLQALLGRLGDDPDSFCFFGDAVRCSCRHCSTASAAAPTRSASSATRCAAPQL